ncbi:hypothetical protein WA556_005843 [Blastocystis sp. ATCC 50177/Nand II]
MRVFVVVLVALEEALKDKVVPYPVRATEAHKQPCAGLLEDGSENAEDEAENETYMDMMTALADDTEASAYQEQIGEESIPHYMMPTKCAAAKAARPTRPTRRVRPAGPVKPFAVADKTTAATRRYVETRSDSRSGPERPKRIPVAATGEPAHFMRETRSSRAMHEGLPKRVYTPRRPAASFRVKTRLGAESSRR